MNFIIIFYVVKHFPLIEHNLFFSRNWYDRGCTMITKKQAWAFWCYILEKLWCTVTIIVMYILSNWMDEFISRNRYFVKHAPTFIFCHDYELLHNFIHSSMFTLVSGDHFKLKHLLYRCRTASHIELTCNFGPWRCYK